MKTINYILQSIAVVLMALFAAVGIFGAEGVAQLPLLTPELLTLLFGSSSGVLLANVGTPSTRIDTGTTDDDRLERDVSKDITEHKPEAARLDTALRKLPSAPLTAKFAEWEEVGQHPRIATIDPGVAAGDDIASAAEVDIPLKNAGEAKYFIINDVLRVHDVTTNTTHVDHAGTRLYVKSRNEAANTITVRAFATGYGKTASEGFVNVPAIPAYTIGTDLQLIRIGHAKSESGGVGEPRSMKPVQYKNGIHTFEKYINISKLRKKLKTYTEDDLKRAIRQAIYDMRLDMESTFWDGVGMTDVHPDEEENMYTMKGVNEFISSNNIALPDVGNITETMFLDWAEQVSDDSHGSDEKMMWVSSALWTEINKIPLIKETLQSKRSERVLGAYVNRIEAGHCVLLVGVHKGFKELGKRRFGSILDPMHLRKRILEPMETVDIRPEPSGGRREEGRKYIETCTVEVRYEKTHALLI